MPTIRTLITKWGFEVDDTPIKNLQNNINRVKTAAKIAAAAIGTGFGFAIKSFVQTSVEVENLQQRLISLTKSEEIAAEKFQAFEEFARRSPFTLQKIIEAGVTLEAFGAQSDDTLEALGDLAAFMGTDLVFAASSLGRAFAAGAGAADILRERGVLELVKSTARLKFGVDDITSVTLPKFREILIATLTDPDGKIAGATDRLAKTLAGKWSLVGDALFRVKRTIGDALSPTIKALISDDIIPAVNALNRWIKTNVRLVGGITKGVRAVIRFTRETVKSILDLTRRLGGVEKVLKQITFIVATLIGLKLISTIGALTIGLFKLATAFKAVGVAAIIAQAKVLAIPLLVGAAVIAVGLLLEDFFVFLKKGNSVFEALLRSLGINVNAARDVINIALAALKTSFKNFFNAILEGLDAIGRFTIKVLTDPFETLSNAATTAFNAIVDGIALVNNKLLNLFGIRNQVVSFFNDIEGFATDAFGSVSDFFGLDKKEPTQGNRAARGFFPTPQDNSISAGIAGRVFNNTSQSSNVNQNVTVSPNVTVTVPPGTPPDQVGPAIESGIENVFGRMLRETQRSGQPAIVF